MQAFLGGHSFFKNFSYNLPCKQIQHFLTLLPLRYCFYVGRFHSKILALPGFGYFSVEHVQSFHDNTKIFQPINLTLD